jgi:hypothetical protein
VLEFLTWPDSGAAEAKQTAKKNLRWKTRKGMGAK